MARIARKLEVEGKSLTEGVALPPESLILEHNSRRFDPDAEPDDEFMLELVNVGQLQPVLIRLNSDNKPVVVAGEQRVRAILKAKELGLVGDDFKVRCEIRDMDESTAFIASVEENARRYAPSVADNAYAARTLYEKHGKTHEDIARIFGKSIGWVSGVVAIGRLPDKILKRIHKGEIKFSAAVELARLDKGMRKEIVERLDGAAEAITEDAIRLLEEELTPPQTEETGEQSQAEDGEGGEATFVQGGGEVERYDTVATPDGPQEADAESGTEVQSPTPKVPKKRGRPKLTVRQRQEKKGKAPLSLKYVRAFFEAQSTPAEGEEANVWNELCGGFGKWMDHAHGDRKMVEIGKTACGIE